MIVRETLANGLELITEAMPHVRSVSMGVWLTRGSRHEEEAQSGIAHFIEHMLFKGTDHRSAQDIAQELDSMGGHLDAFTSKEYAGYYIKVLDEHVPRAFDILADIIRNPAFAREDVEREKRVILEEIKMVEDTPDDLVHELFTQHYWAGHPLGRPILGTRETVEGFDPDVLRSYFEGAYVGRNLILAAAGNLRHEVIRDLVERAFDDLRAEGYTWNDGAPTIAPQLVARQKELEQSHVCVGTIGYPQVHDDRFVCYLLNIVLGGSMSSRLFQNIREKRGLAYSVFSGLSAYRDAGLLTIYAGCANDTVPEVLDLVVEELRSLRREPVSSDELRRAKDHLKGSLMLSLESTSSRMTHLARQEIYFDRAYTIDEVLEGIEAVTIADIQRVAADLFSNGSLGVTLLGPDEGVPVEKERLDLE
ncbi:MAG: insulinase family protein [Luteitalea sp.]|nr:insulinase family protein [Luteitalea sp.]